MHFDPRTCITTLKDRSADPGHREDAADNLMFQPTELVRTVMREIVLDESEDRDFRLEVAGCLGSVMADLKTDLIQETEIKEPFFSEMVREFNLRSE